MKQALHSFFQFFKSPLWRKLSWIFGGPLLLAIYHSQPILKRELIATLRTKRAFWLLFIVVGVSGLIAISVWPREAQGMSDMHKIQIFTSFNYSLLIGIFLFVPAFTSGAISREREEGTYELLYTTLLPPSSIILAKIGSSAGYILLILASTLPITPM